MATAATNTYQAPSLPCLQPTNLLGQLHSALSFHTSRCLPLFVFVCCWARTIFLKGLAALIKGALLAIHHGALQLLQNRRRAISACSHAALNGLGLGGSYSQPLRERENRIQFALPLASCCRSKLAAYILEINHDEHFWPESSEHPSLHLRTPLQPTRRVHLLEG